MSVDPRTAGEAMRNFRKFLPTAVMRGLRKGLPIAVRLAKTKYMERKSNLHPFKVFDPPNPPPGPLAIRSGDLARTVRVGDMRFNGKSVTGTIEAGNAQIRYAKVHELGMRISARGPNLVFPVGIPGGGFRMVKTPSVIIRPRPFLRPAMIDAERDILRLVKAEILALARVTLKDMARFH